MIALSGCILYLTQFDATTPWSICLTLQRGVPGVRTLAIGDGANDVAMIQVSVYVHKVE